MKAVGIIAEYNPLHNGHIYQLEQAKKIAGADVAVVAMSGDFVQRGEPAIFDKWTRARHALNNGADLVIEIPVLYCLGNAGQFAYGGVSALEALGKVSHIAFGSECGDADLLKRVADRLDRHEEEIRLAAAAAAKSGITYPAARAAEYVKIARREYEAGFDPDGSDWLDPDRIRAAVEAESAVLSMPNDTLAVEYIRAAAKLEPVAVLRDSSSHRDEIYRGGRFASSTAVRKMIQNGENVGNLVPGDVAEEAPADACFINDPWMTALRYAVLSAEPFEIDECPSGGEGLGMLMRSAALSCEKWDDFIDRVKSRRYTYTRIQRLCMQTLLGIRRSDFAGCRPDYVRVLGAGSEGRQLLAEIRNEDAASLPVITNINKEYSGGSELLELDVHAADIYNLINGRDMWDRSDHRVRPVMI